MYYNKINERILELCRQRHWSKYKLAQESQISNSAINAMFKHNHVPTFYNLEKICSAFKITLSQFFDCDLFDNKKDTPLYIRLWEELSISEKKLVITYMHGLLHKTIEKEDFLDDI